jgi:hypothetical protein
MSRYIWKLCGVSFAFGGAMEFVMIKTGFYEHAVKATASAPQDDEMKEKWENFMEQLRVKHENQLKERAAAQQPKKDPKQ